MIVVASNCGCCAIKHIRDFVYSPDTTIYVYSSDGHNEDQGGTEPSAYDQFEQVEKSGQYVAGEHFRFLVNQIKSRRPAGMITLNLAASPEGNYCCEDCDGCTREEYYENHDSGFDYAQIDNWRPVFEELGFAEHVFMNSNSGGEIHHFTLTYDEGGY